MFTGDCSARLLCDDVREVRGVEAEPVLSTGANINCAFILQRTQCPSEVRFRDSQLNCDIAPPFPYEPYRDRVQYSRLRRGIFVWDREWNQAEGSSECPIGL